MRERDPREGSVTGSAGGDVSAQGGRGNAAQGREVVGNQVQGDDGKFRSTTSGAAYGPQMAGYDPRMRQDDPNRFRFLGQEGLAYKYANDLRAQAEAAQGRAAPQLNLADYNTARTQQMGLLTGYENMAAGGGPSLAQYGTNRAMDAAASRSGLAMATASPSNMAGAGRLAMLGGGAAANQAASAGATDRAAEIANARGQIGNISGQVRNNDIANTLQQGNLDMSQRNLNDKSYDALNRYAQGILKMDQTGGQAGITDKIGWDEIAANKDIADRRAGAAKEQSDINTALGAGSAGFSALGALAPFLIFSDENLKENVSDGSSAVRKTIDSLAPKSYRYKADTGLDTRQRLGIMAQDLEKTPLGKAAVVETPKGKMVDVGQLTGLAMAAISDMSRRLNKLEKR